MTQSFDPTILESRALAGVKPFQRATIERVDALFRNGRRRILVADEVGLGKTVVARGVLANMARLRREEGDNLFKVAYICANQNIVRQNLKALTKGIEEFVYVDSDSTDARLSMLPLLVEMQERKLSEERKYIQIVPITPETSFRMGNRRGLKEERALLCALLRDFSGCDEQTQILFERLRCGVRSDWKETVNAFTDKVNEVKRLNPSFLKELEKDFGKEKDDIISRLLVSGSNDAIRELREIFARIGAEKLHPDLVILDEFQRFRYLIDPPKGEDGGEVKILFDKFLRDDGKNNDSASGDGEDQPRVLMLSATPFKLHSTRTQDANEGANVSYEEFKGLLEFLFGKDSAVWDEWNRYVAALFPEKWDDGPGEALLEKGRAEEALRKGICRTERTLVERLGQSVNPLRITLLPDPREIRAFRLYSQWAKSIGADGRLRTEYAKSAPYLLSFLTGYREQDRLEKTLEKADSKVFGTRRTPGMVQNALWIDQKTVKKYGRIDWANKRLELLAAHAFAEEGSFHPERLLWIPPTMPCYPPSGPFASSDGFSKVLVFSSWQMVPKMTAVLLSYETERRTIATLHRHRGETLNYFSKKRIPAPRLQFRSKGRGSSPATMTLFCLLYPSKTLADLFSAVKARNAGCESPRTAADEIARNVRSRLEALPDPPDGREDTRWYYLAPMLLDGKKSAKEWLRKARRLFRGIKGSASALRHLKTLEGDLRAGADALGRRPNDLCEVLANMALGSPAVCMRRAGAGEATSTRVSEAFRNFFNSPEAIAAVECSIRDVYGASRAADSHWKNVLLYGSDGCLQSVLDEYLHMLDPEKSFSVLDLDSAEKSEPAKNLVKLVETIEAALSFRSAPYLVDTFAALRDRTLSPGEVGDSKKMPMRTHFAAAFAEGDGGGEKVANRVESLRGAFNSPFRPFVLASTSIGQEGLDFHWYCRKVFHWNLPHNPVDLEQREGRVDRFRGLAVRENVAAQFSNKRDFVEDMWKELFDEAERAAKAVDPSGLIPNWRNGAEARWKIERIVPLYSCSADETRYAELVERLARFRMAIGQPQQENLLDRFMQRGVDLETIRRFFLDLCPFSSNMADATLVPVFVPWPNRAQDA